MAWFFWRRLASRMGPSIIHTWCLFHKRARLYQIWEENTGGLWESGGSCLVQAPQWNGNSRRRSFETQMVTNTFERFNVGLRRYTGLLTYKQPFHNKGGEAVGAALNSRSRWRWSSSSLHCLATFLCVLLRVVLLALSRSPLPGRGEGTE